MYMDDAVCIILVVPLKYKIVFITYRSIEEFICNLSMPLPLLVFHCEVLIHYVLHT